MLPLLLSLVVILCSAALFFSIMHRPSGRTPVVVNTWAFTDATSKAWDVLAAEGAALDAVEQVSGPSLVLKAGLAAD